jgi:C-terminal processing protease CtpA/Prc
MKKIFIFLLFLYSSQIFPQSLTTKQIKKDIDSLISVLLTIHPTFNESPNKQRLLVLRDTINTSLTIHELFRTLQPLVALDGHTTLRFNGPIYPEVENPLLPFGTIVYDNQLYVKHNLSADTLLTKGTEILKINGVPASDIINNIINYLPGEKPEYKIRKLDNEAFSNWYRLVYGNFEKFEIEYRGTDGKELTIVEGVHWDQFPKYEEDSHIFRIIDQNIGYLRVGRFWYPKIFLPFMDSVFTEIKNQNIDNLIIDKTQGGGLSMLTDSLFCLITDTPFCDLEKKKIRISKETEEFIEEKLDDGEQQGEYFVISKKPQPPVYKSNRFAGNVYILAGPKAYSAATMFVAMAKCYSNSIIIGEETGQPLISNGDISRYKLPNSGMYIYTSLSIYYLPCAENKYDGVKPDYEIKLTHQDLLNDADKYLEFAIKLVKQKEE